MVCFGLYTPQTAARRQALSGTLLCVCNSDTFVLCHVFTSLSPPRMYVLLVLRYAACGAYDRQEPTMDRVNTLRNAYEFIVTFLESMVESTVDVQKENQTVLR